MSLLLVGCATHAPAPVVDRSGGVQAPVVAPVVTPAAAPEAAKPAPERVARKGYYLVKEGDRLIRIALDHGQDYRDLAAWNKLEDPNKILVGQELRVAPPEGDAASPIAVTKPVVSVRPIEQRTLEGNTEGVKTEPKAGREVYTDEALARLNKAEPAVTRVELKPEVKPEVKPDGKAEVKPEGKPEVRPAAKGDDEPDWVWPASGKVIAGYVDGGNKGVDLAGKKGDPVLAAGDGKVVYSGSGLRGYGQLLIVKHNNTFLTAYAHNSKILIKEGQTVTRGQKIAEMGDSETDQVKLHFEVRRQGKPVDPMKYLPPR